MNEILLMVLAFTGGMLLGTLFFGGLWFTVKKAVFSKMPALWISGSFIFRVGIALAGFYFIASGNWQRLVTCLLGFIVARFLVIYMTKTMDQKKAHVRKEVDHEA
ncbi:MAG: ATP synthase subunit I [Chitinophagaceae bacterium]